MNPYIHDDNPIAWDPAKRVIQLRVDTTTFDHVVPVTAGATAFQTGRLPTTVHLTAGTHEVGIMYLGQNQNFDWMEFTKVS